MVVTTLLRNLNDFISYRHKIFYVSKVRISCSMCSKLSSYAVYVGMSTLGHFAFCAWCTPLSVTKCKQLQNVVVGRGLAQAEAKGSLFALLVARALCSIGH